MAKRKPIVQADTEDGQLAGEAIVEAVENQIRENNPPEVKRTLKRLMGMGESRENAMRYIASTLSVEIYEVMKHQTPFDADRYVKNLKELPNLPFDEDEQI